MRWTLELESDNGRWRAAWTTDDKPDIPCGCESSGPPWHGHHCHHVKRPGGGWGWHRSEQSAIACAEKVLRYWRTWFEMNRWWMRSSAPGEHGSGRLEAGFAARYFERSRRVVSAVSPRKRWTTSGRSSSEAQVTAQISKLCARSAMPRRLLQ